MKIGVIATVVDSGELTGIERYVAEFLHNTPKEYLKSIVVFAHRRGMEILRKLVPEANIRVSPFNNRILTDQLWLPRAMRKDSIDFFYNMSLAFPWRQLKIPFSFILHDATPWRFPETMSHGMKYYYLPQINRALKSRYLRSIITPSRSSSHDIASYCRVKPSLLHAVHLGVNRNLFKPINDDHVITRHVSNKDKYILSVGTLEPRKNLQVMLNAFEIISSVDSDVSLVIVGRQGWENELRVPPAVSEKVFFTGYIPEHELVTLYSNAEALVFPSLYEGFGFPLVEAMSCGTPVVASNTSSLPEIGQDACLYVEPTSAEDIAAKVLLLLKDDALRRNLTEKGLKRSGQFDWNLTVLKTWEILIKICSECSEGDVFNA